MIKIEQTTNYGKFKTIRGNREINRVHLSKLEKSVADNNMLEANPIIVNERMYILDGQHRLLVAEKLGIPIYYVVVPSGGMPEVQRLNSNVRNWTMQNFLDSYVERGNENYIKLKEFMDRTGLAIGLAVLLFNGAQKKTKGADSYVQVFKDGDFKVNFQQFAEDMFQSLIELTPYCDEESWQDRAFVTALILVYRAGITQETLLGKLKSSSIRIPRLATRRQYVKLLEDVLSHKNKAPVRLI